ncbi:protein NLRC5-like [Dysidea avara]|uniref:protein NLRC5-like n=1 Tax=Dysidea avara TaxID=196820 RepID=UPI003325AE2C
MDQSNGKGLEQFRTAEYATSTPLLKDLYQYITPDYAADWKVIGTLLGLPSGELKSIEAGYPTNVKWCCNQMLEKWLEVEPSASWNKLLSVIQSPAVSSDQATEKVVTGEDVASKVQPVHHDKLTVKGAEEVSMLSNRVATTNAQARFRADKDTWPPGQPHSFTPLLLVHHEGQQRMDQAVEVAKLVHKGDVTSEQLVHTKLDDHASHVSKVTKEVTKILAPLEEREDPQFIMIEGAPGIGKSVLLREIAYRWGKQQLLQTFTLLVLVCLRDPIVQQATSISDLLLSFCKGDRRAKEIAAACSDYLFENGGKHLLFLFDGFDEFPEHLRENSLIGEIINRNILPLCGLVVSSRPHASVSLQQQATIKVDILGFTKEEQSLYIEQSLKGQPQSIEKLTRYLQDHLTISSLCLVPFNIVILLFLYKMGIPLPSDSSSIYHHFICLTICRHLAKSGCPLKNDIKQLADLPEPYSKIVKQLSKLALQALNNNQLVFTYEEIEAACPDVIATPEGINGFGLLQAVQHFGLTGETTTFNFLHLTIQEYLAANYIITDLRPDEEYRLLREQFWSDIHANMFSIYITLSNGQRSSFKKFLSGGDDKIAISNKFLREQLKCFRLFRCFHDARDYRMCKSIEEAEIFNKKEIYLSSTRLSATDLECVSLFLTSSSHKQWVWLYLTSCYIQDRGLHILHKHLINNDVTITNLVLMDNGLTNSSSSFVSDIVLSCKVEVLWISGNDTIGESEELYTMLTHPSSMLTRLIMNNTSLSSIAARTLFTAVKDTNKLKELDISYNAITDDVADVFTLLTTNKSLVVLWMSGNPISREAMTRSLQALRGNNTLQELYVPSYPPAIRSIEQEINTKRRSQGIQEKLTVY